MTRPKMHVGRSPALYIEHGSLPDHVCFRATPVKQAGALLAADFGFHAVLTVQELVAGRRVLRSAKYGEVPRLRDDAHRDLKP